jgi:hypothetical protein
MTGLNRLLITSLVDNRLDWNRALSKESGLSLHIQINDQEILFDTGLSDLYSQNARQSNLDNGRVHPAVLSHTISITPGVSITFSGSTITPRSTFDRGVRAIMCSG